jgi:beta-lactam-binding protein with PASTA domain
MVLVAGCHLSASGSLTGGSSTLPTGPTGSADSDVITVPDLFQRTRAEAQAALAQAGYHRELQLDTAICGSVVDDKVIELGHICAQSPGPGNQTSTRVAIYIRVQGENPWHGVSAGRPWFLMPDLTGLRREQATAKIQALGFTSKEVQIVEIDDGSCAPNVVCRTYPEARRRTDTTSDKAFYVGKAARSAEPSPDAKPASTSDAKPTAKPAATPPKPAAKPSLGDLF